MCIRNQLINHANVIIINYKYCDDNAYIISNLRSHLLQKQFVNDYIIKLRCVCFSDWLGHSRWSYSSWWMSDIWKFQIVCWMTIML